MSEFPPAERLGGVRTIEIRGDARERGEQYGEQAADLIAKAIEFYTESFGERTGMTWQQVADRALHWEALCRKAAPEIVAEIEGIAAGSGRTLGDILALNIRGEVSYDPTFASEPDGSEEPADGCTSFALMDGASGDGHRYVGQNWDWCVGTMPTVVVLRIVQDPAPTIIMQIEAGQIGRHGANSAGISLNANGLGGRIDGSFGLPQTFIRRMTLNQHHFSRALAVQMKTRGHISSNALLAQAGGYAVDLETTPRGVRWMHPQDGLLVHGNHFAAGIPEQLLGDYRIVSPDSLFRVDIAQRGLRRIRDCEGSDVVVKEVHRTMSDHFGYPDSLCNHPDLDRPYTRRYATLVSALVDLTSGEYRVTDGYPCGSDYELLPWNLYDGPSLLDPHTGAPRVDMELAR